MHRFLRVVMREAFQNFADDYFNAQFFAQLPRQTFLEGLARLAFAAGKFPQATEMIVGTPLSDQEFSSSENQTGGDFNDVAAVQRPMLL